MTSVAVILTDTTDDTRVSEMSTRWKHKRQDSHRTALWNCSVLLPHNKINKWRVTRENDIFRYSPHQSLDEILYIWRNINTFHNPGIKKFICLCPEK